MYLYDVNYEAGSLLNTLILVHHINFVFGMSTLEVVQVSIVCFLILQEGFYSDPDTKPSVTAPGILLVISSLGITALFALGPGKEMIVTIS